MILPGFATDIIGFFLILPITRKIFFSKLSNLYKKKEHKKNDFIEGEFEDIEEKDNDRKI